MKYKLCDGDKGLKIWGIILLVLGIVNIIIGIVAGIMALPFLFIGLGILGLAILIIIPHEYIDEKIELR